MNIKSKILLATILFNNVYCVPPASESSEGVTVIIQQPSENASALSLECKDTLYQVLPYTAIVGGVKKAQYRTMQQNVKFQLQGGEEVDGYSITVFFPKNNLDSAKLNGEQNNLLITAKAKPEKTVKPVVQQAPKAQTARPAVQPQTLAPTTSKAPVAQPVTQAAPTPAAVQAPATQPSTSTASSQQPVPAAQAARPAVQPQTLAAQTARPAVQPQTLAPTKAQQKEEIKKDLADLLDAIQSPTPKQDNKYLENANVKNLKQGSALKIKAKRIDIAKSINDLLAKINRVETPIEGNIKEWEQEKNKILATLSSIPSIDASSGSQQPALEALAAAAAPTQVSEQTNAPLNTQAQKTLAEQKIGIQKDLADLLDAIENALPNKNNKYLPNTNVTKWRKDQKAPYVNDIVKSIRTLSSDIDKKTLTEQNIKQWTQRRDEILNPTPVSPRNK